MKKDLLVHVTYKAVFTSHVTYKDIYIYRYIFNLNKTNTYISIYD